MSKTGPFQVCIRSEHALVRRGAADALARITPQGDEEQPPRRELRAPLRGAKREKGKGARRGSNSRGWV